MPLPSTPRRVASISGPFRVLTLCTGNVCRSPLAEALLRDRLTAAFGGDAVEVSSAGTIGLVGEPMDAMAAQQAERLGLQVDAFRARRLAPTMVADAHLVVALAREHRAAAVEADATAARRAFTLLELATILGRLEPEAVRGQAVGARAVGGQVVSTADRLAAVIDAAAASRGTLGPEPGAPIDVEDPYGRSAEVHRRVADTVERAVDEVIVHLRRLFGALSP